jgi:hypothetical protein
VRVPDEIHINPGLSRRIDLMAVANPRSVRRLMWFHGILFVWCSISLVSSLATQRWSIVAIVAPAVLIGAVGWSVWFRARRRMPQTKRWLDELAG